MEVIVRNWIGEIGKDEGRDLEEGVWLEGK